MTTDLKHDLAALRIEREPERPGIGRWIVWTGLLILLAAIGFAGWRWFTRERPVEVQVATVTERAAGTQAAVLNASGYVTARRRATVSSKITGKVVEVNVEEGHGGQGGPGAGAARRFAAPRRRSRSPRRRPKRRAATSRENEVRLARGHARRSAARSSCSADRLRHRRPTSTRRRRRSIRSTARIDAAREQVRVAERQIDVAADRSRQHRHPRAVQRHRDLQGRAARRNGVAGVGRRRLHAHRHLHHRRHEVARDRSRRQRELHQPRAARAAGRPPCSTRIPTGRFRRTSSRSCRRPIGRRRRCSCASASTQLDPRILPDMGVKVTFLRDADGGRRRPTARSPTTLVPKAAVRTENGDSRTSFVVHGGRVERRAVETGGDRRRSRRGASPGLARRARRASSPPAGRLAVRRHRSRRR